MGYVESNLLPNEQITYRAKLHWIIYTLPAIVFVIAILLALGGGGIATAVVGVTGLLLLLPPWIKASRTYGGRKRLAAPSRLLDHASTS
jgi:hypothetical protein